jgi:hypothetical protein
MPKHQLTIHVGLHKTGTSYLQNLLFPAMPGVKVIRGGNSHRQLLSIDEDVQTIISDENISGRAWGGTYQTDFVENVNRLSQLYQDPKIIFGIRDQRTLIPSFYKQYLHEKGTGGVECFFNQNNTGLLKAEDLFFEPKIKLLKNLFSDVFIYRQQFMSENGQALINALSNFLGVDSDLVNVPSDNRVANIGIQTTRQAGLLIKANHLNFALEKIHPRLSMYSARMKKLGLTPRNLIQNHMRGTGSSKFTFPPDLIKFIEEYYREDFAAACQETSC